MTATGDSTEGALRVSKAMTELESHTTKQNSKHALCFQLEN